MNVTGALGWLSKTGSDLLLGRGRSSFVVQDRLFSFLFERKAEHWHLLSGGVCKGAAPLYGVKLRELLGKSGSSPGLGNQCSD